jgi:uncharacterized membrane protein YhaH (DUF805 family)
MNELFGFSGRIGRGPWWLGQLLNSLGWAIGLMFAAEAIKDTGSGLYWILAAGSIIMAVWINLSGTVQRYHDRGKSGFWFFINLIPLIGWIIFFVELAFFPGTPGANRYGPPPGAGGVPAGKSVQNDPADDFDADTLIAKYKAEKLQAGSVAIGRQADLLAARPARHGSSWQAGGQETRSGFGQRSFGKRSG